MAAIDRRDFLKLVGVGAGTAAASSGGCYRYSDLPVKLIPYVVQPEEITPGIAVDYASTCLECPSACGLHVRTCEARPVKLEGNPDHPVNRGALCARGQASIGRTYHPDRYRGPLKRGSDGALAPTTWEEAAALLAAKLGTAGPAARFLTAPMGPTLSGLLDHFAVATGGGPRVEYVPIDRGALRQAATEVFGQKSEPIFDLTETDFVIDFGGDFLDSGPSPVELQRQFKQARDVLTQAGRDARFVYVGPRLSTTAGNADEWVTAKPGTEGLLALAIAKVAFDERRGSGLPVGGDPGVIGGLLSGFEVGGMADRTGVSAKQIESLGKAAASARRAVALPPGPGLEGANAVAANAAVLLLDAVLGAVGESVNLVPVRDDASYADVKQLVEDMRAGRVDVLMLHGGNPVYSLPELGFADALKQVDLVVSFASLPDETSELADLVLPDHTPLESWGDAAPRPGVRSIVQPTLRPLYDTQALGDSLLQVGRAMGDDVAGKFPEGSFRQVLETAWADTDWRQALGRGGVFTAVPAAGGTVKRSAARIAFDDPKFEGDGDFVLLSQPSPLLYDGRGATLPWLQEIPDPVTKIAWQSWLEVNHEIAKKLGVAEGDVVSIETAAGSAEVPVFPRGGIREDVVALAMGQGHKVGLFASHANDGEPGEARGVNAFELLPAVTDEAGGRAWLTTKARITPTGKHRRLANTQRSDNKRRRQLGEAISLATLARGDWNAEARSEFHGRHGEADHGGGNYEAAHANAEDHGEGSQTATDDAAAAGHGAAAAAGHGAAAAAGHGAATAHEILRPFDPTADAYDDSPYRWGMSIDLDRCSGCSACVVACSIENNVATVGEKAVLRNRQMQWLRIERFIGEGDDELLTGRTRPEDREKLGNVDVRHSPMLCQQCGAAPCEPVCPVLATYHTGEGLNAMIYNRCIGTRYCANNCPYKVRRFNWFDYEIHNFPEPMRLMLNPDVTVRGQGVMEKCNFCVQRIQQARQLAKDEGRPIADGEAVPACEQTCPSNAIVFGNLKDAKSEARTQIQENQGRTYHALQVLNTRPGITYLARVERSTDGEDHG
ncbi:MAG: 4Fe-4S dicluster domain-containing protein [bacterium]|jgi:molybdopterin-containing oxidoreductase family iron-sulfur binding subunit|nr:4Fe-4S dicluster domain-containing protein [bacterium]